MRPEDRLDISPHREMTVAVNKGNNNYDAFLKEYFPNWKVEYFENSEEGFSAVANEEADCLLISNYRILQMNDMIQTHRLSTIKNCDKIMYINDGGITECGSHDELMAKKGDYYHLYTAQVEGLEVS